MSQEAIDNEVFGCLPGTVNSISERTGLSPITVQKSLKRHEASSLAKHEIINDKLGRPCQKYYSTIEEKKTVRFDHLNALFGRYPETN